jgi:hypothetical protein
MRKSGYRALSSAAVVYVFASLCLLSGCNSSDRQLRKGFVSVEKMDIHVPSDFLQRYDPSNGAVPSKIRSQADMALKDLVMNTESGAGENVYHMSSEKYSSWQDYLERTFFMLSSGKSTEAPEISGAENVICEYRKAGKDDIFWLKSLSRSFMTKNLAFAIKGKSAEIWDPVTGLITPLSTMASEGKTSVTLSFTPEDSFFLVFSSRSSGNERATVSDGTIQSMELTSPWEIMFNGSNERIIASELLPWREYGDGNERSEAEEATYVQAFELPDTFFAQGCFYELDLGKVEDIVRVIINGVDLGTFWESPFVISAGETLKPGTNSISITATRLSSGTVDEKVSSRLGGLYGKVILRSIPSGASVTRNDIQDEENNNAIAGKLDAASWFD